MAFQKLKNDGEEIFETLVRDSSGKLLEKWKVAKKDYIKVVIILDQKYGINLRMKVNDKNQLKWSFA